VQPILWRTSLDLTGNERHGVITGFTPGGEAVTGHQQVLRQYDLMELTGASTTGAFNNGTVVWPDRYSDPYTIFQCEIRSDIWAIVFWANWTGQTTMVGVIITVQERILPLKWITDQP
jgi:hypothetical protein